MKAQERQLSLVAYLHHHRFGRTLDEILEAIPAYGSGDAARKKLQRDRALLKEIGLPLQVVEQAGDGEDGNLRYAYVLDRREAFARSLRLSDAERELLLRLCEHLLSAPSFTHSEWIVSARDKVLAAGLVEHAAPLESAGIPMGTTSPVGSREGEQILERVLEALESAHCLTFTYQGLQHEAPTWRKVHPRQLCAWRGKWLLKAWCELRGGPRSFVLQRMVDVAVSTDPVRSDLPSEASNARRGWELGLGEGPMAKVELDSDVARLAQRQVADLSEAVIQHTLPDGRLLLSFSVGHPAYFYSWLLSWGRQARLVESPQIQAGLIPWMEGRA